jgi:hypothetical protein
MITKKDLEKLEREMKNACRAVSRTNNEATRQEVDEAVNKYIEAEKEYLQQRKTIIIKYFIGARPIGNYEGEIEVYEDATKEEIKKEIYDNCQFSCYYEINGKYISVE